ncbi:MAG: AAA family ATPase, partial [Bacteroides sp.]
MATKGIPYGLSDYARLSTENYYYVDKTTYILS